MRTFSKAIGILGTAKNTGKTTTANFILNCLNSEGIRTGLTSIGYDGEDIDNITGLPKPRVLIQKGNLIATAEQCLSSTDNRIEIIEKTPVYTALGQVIIARALKDGMVVLAGPNKGKDLQLVLEKFKKHKIEITVVDGALNRMIPLIYCDALIFATGASRNTNVDFLADEIESMYQVFNLPFRKKETNFDNNFLIRQKNITIIQQDGNRIVLKDHSLLNQKILTELVNHLNENDSQEIYIPGIIQDSFLTKIAQDYYRLFEDKSIIIHNPAFLLVGSKNIAGLKTLLRALAAKRIIVKTLQSLPILAVTINPFYPKYSRFGTEKYEIAYIDEFYLYNKMKNKVNFPVINVEGEGKEKILPVLKKMVNINTV